MQYSVRTLSREEYPLWDKLIANSPQRSIFTQRWWMDIVTNGGVNLLGCFDENGLVAGFPIWPCTLLGVKRLRQPPLTPYWGPVLAPIDENDASRFSAEIEILRAFAMALTSWPDATIACHPSLENWLPFYWNGYEQTTRYTYRIEELADHLPAGKNLHRSIRSALNRAKNNGLKIEEMVDPMLVAEMSRLSMARQDLQSSAEIRAFWPALSQAGEERQCIFNAAAVDADGNFHAAYAMVWDDRYAYDIYGGGVPKYRESGGGTLALHHILMKAATVAPSFDFEGSMIESIGRYFRHLGGELTPYHLVTRAQSVRLNVARLLKRKAKRPHKPARKSTVVSS